MHIQLMVKRCTPGYTLQATEPKAIQEGTNSCRGGATTNAWIYVFDEFKSIDIDTKELLELAEKDPLKLFDIIREVLTDIKEVKDVKLYNTYFNPKNFELLIEYIVIGRDLR